MVDEVATSSRWRNERAPHVKIEAGISTAFGCTLQGIVPEDEVIRLAEQVIEAEPTNPVCPIPTGHANPAQVKRLFARLHSAVGDHAGAAHMHNTPRLGLANCLAAWRWACDLRRIAGRPRRLTPTHPGHRATW